MREREEREKEKLGRQWKRSRGEDLEEGAVSYFDPSDCLIARNADARSDNTTSSSILSPLHCLARLSLSLDPE